MQRRNFGFDANARHVQVGGLLIVLLAVVAVLAHALVHEQRAATAAAKSSDKQDAAQFVNFNAPPPAVR